MKAEDTVMSRGEIIALLRGMPFTPVTEKGWLNFTKRCLQAQAETTFPLGRQDGVEEVVEWVEKNSHANADYNSEGYMRSSWLEIYQGCWQAYKKKLGYNVQMVEQRIAGKEE